MKRTQSGFTLVEVAIVLVIIGILLGGILKGQEFINNARVRNVTDQQTGMQAAYFAFQDRYRALPGDYLGAQAIANIPGGATMAYTGDGNGNIGNVAAETGQAWAQLTAAGFISCTQCTSVAAASTAAANTPKNIYGGWLVFIHNATYADAGTAVARNHLNSGSSIPVTVLAEVDRKTDDGNANTGNIRFTAAAQPTAPTAANCHTTGTWRANTTEPNCGAATLL